MECKTDEISVFSVHVRLGFVDGRTSSTTTFAPAEANFLTASPPNPCVSLSSQALAGGAHTAVVTYACTSGHEDYLIFRLKRLNFVPLLNARLAAH